MKYKIAFIPYFLMCVYNCFAQNVGVGTTTPVQILDVNGKLKVGNDNAVPVGGTIRFNDAVKDFEGYTGTEWKSLTASNSSSPYTEVGVSVERKGDAISIYGNVAAVGATYVSSAGKVFILERINNAWVQKQTLFEPEGSFGSSVAMYGDYLIVGSPFYSQAYGRGRISLYKKINNSFVLLSHYFPSILTSGEYFGCSLSMHGGLIAVGCITNLRGFVSPTNRVHVLSILNNGLQPEQVVYNPNTPAQEDFGISLAIDSAKLIIGAPKANNFGNTQRGKVYVYAYAGANTYAYTNSLEYPAYGAAYDYFGEDISLSGNNLVIGCPGLDINPLFNIGAFFICTKDASGNFESDSLIIYTHPFDAAETFFGKAVAISNNVIVIGSNKAVYQYTKNNDIWQMHKTLSNSLPGISEIDASTVAIFGQNYGIGNPLFANNTGRIILGDCRY
jgi:hypothetical protein